MIVVTVASEDDSLADSLAALVLAAPLEAPEARAALEARLVRRGDDARRAGEARAVVEAAALRALLAVDDGRGDGAELARRAALMAQAERTPEAQPLTALVLARLRRQQGRPYLALHILGGIGAAVSPTLRSWWAWERLVAGGDAQSVVGGREATRELVPGRAPQALHAVLAAVRAGDASAFRRAGALLRAVALPPAFRREADAALLLLDPAAAPGAGAGKAEDFRAGGPELPFGLHGLGGDGEEAALAHVVVWPDRPSVRVLTSALPLVGEVHRLHTVPGDDAGARTDSGLAALALAGPEGLPAEAFFRRVYGFAYQAPLHRGALNTLVLRMRARLADTGGSIERGEAQIGLRLVAPLALPDPRVTLPSGDRLLRALVRLGPTGAQDAAAALGISLRSVQLALQRLVADGEVGVIHEGRRVVYRVQDTVFSVVTSATP
jgi:hypothetical protein